MVQYLKKDLKKSRRRRLNQSSTWSSGTLSGESHVWVWSGEIQVLVLFSGVGFGKRSRFFVGHGLYLEVFVWSLFEMRGGDRLVSNF